LSAENTAARLQKPNSEYSFNGVRSVAKVAYLLLSCLSDRPLLSTLLALDVYS